MVVSLFAIVPISASATTHTHDDITFEPWESTTSLPTTAGNYYLTDDVTLPAT